MNKRALIIAIDGPSGAGKGTVARTLAHTLGYAHIDTGAMYRAVAWQALRDGVDLADAVTLSLIAGREMSVTGDRVTIDGHDVTSEIRTPEIDRAAAVVSRHPNVRRVLVDRQRRDAEQGGVVMEGRDIGTVVFPGADVKLYLDAAPEERARRRATDPAHASGRSAAAIESVAEALAQRDQSDRTRATSPLVAAPDAISIDTTGVPVEAVLQQVLDIVRRQLPTAVAALREPEG
jgi:cytidylate kinase